MKELWSRILQDLSSWESSILMIDEKDDYLWMVLLKNYDLQFLFLSKENTILYLIQIR